MSRKGIGNYEPTDEAREQVRRLKAIGLTQAKTAEYLGISEDTLQRHYGKELSLGDAEATSKVYGTLFKLATSGKCPAATIFWMKTRAGWREVEQVSDEAKQPLPQIIVHVDPKPAK